MSSSRNFLWFFFAKSSQNFVEKAHYPDAIPLKFYKNSFNPSLITDFRTVSNETYDFFSYFSLFVLVLCGIKMYWELMKKTLYVFQPKKSRRRDWDWNWRIFKSSLLKNGIAWFAYICNWHFFRLCCRNCTF